VNKKLNTILFILGATLFNVLIAVLSFIGLLVLYVKFLMPLIPEGGQSWGFTLIFISAIAISILVYRYLLKFLLTKVNVERYFDPLFVRKTVKKD